MKRQYKQGCGRDQFLKTKTGGPETKTEGPATMTETKTEGHETKTEMP
jgi:hypothetical protein